MDKYLSQLFQDIENTIVDRWNTEPPNTFRMGMMNNWQDPPIGYTGKPFGYENKVEDEEADDNETAINFEETIKEVENYLEPNKSIARLPFIEFTDLHIDQFPQADLLTESQLEMLVSAVSRLLTSYNFMVPTSNVPPRFIYPLLIETLNKPCSITRHGFIGIEFCHFNSDDCPFGGENCECKDKW